MCKKKSLFHPSIPASTGRFSASVTLTFIYNYLNQFSKETQPRAEKLHVRF